MRKFRTSDVFVMARIIKKADIKEDLVKAFSAGASGTVVVGVEAVMSLLMGCADKEVEGMIYKFIGDVAGMKPENIQKMELTEFKALLIEMGEVNDLVNFFHTASKLA